MPHLEQRLSEAAAYIRGCVTRLPQVGLVLGSGLGDFADTLPGRHAIPAGEIPHYPVATVEGHKGRLVFAEVRPGVTALAFQGRIHFYESNDTATVLFPIRIAHALGVRVLVITNAAGGINRNFLPGDLMVITDHINLTTERTSEYIPEANRTSAPVYDPALSDMAIALASSLEIPVRRGVYAGVKGPSYETAAEVEMLHRLGGDAVGMSTVLEAHLAAALGMRVLGISCITNKATGIGMEPLSHAEVTEVAARVRERFTRFLTTILTQLPVDSR